MSDKQSDLRKLCLMKLDINESDEAIRSMCEQFGPLMHFSRPPNKKELAFALYGNEGIAKSAKDSLSGIGISVAYAHSKKVENAQFNGEKNDRSFQGSVQQRISNQKQPTNSASKMAESTDIQTYSSTTSINKMCGICSFCNKDANLICQRCGEFYCSAECQDEDWLSHKKVCFPMPKLVKCYCTNRRHYKVPLDKSISVENISIVNAEIRKNSFQAIDAPDSGMRTPTTSEKQVVKPSPIKITKTIEQTVAHEPPKPKYVEEPKPAKMAEEPVKAVANRSPSVETIKKADPIEPIVAKTESSSKRSTGRSMIGTFLEERLDSMKINIEPKSAMEEIDTYTIDNGDIVQICSIPNHFSVFVRSTKTDDEFARIIVAVNEAAAKAPTPSIYPSRSDLVLAPFEGEYYRALVLHVNLDEKNLNVAFIDFGNKADVSFDSIKICNDDLKKYRRLPVRVFLKNVEHDVDAHESEAMMEYLKKFEYADVKIRCDDSKIVAKSMVELIEMKTDKVINETVAGMAKKRFYIVDIERKQVNSVNESILIIEARNLKESAITGVLKSNASQFGDQHSIIQKYGNTVKMAPAYAPRHLEMCVVKIMDDEEPVWYRAQFHTLLANGRAQVGLLDYGINENVLENDIRPFDEQLAFECLSLTCQIVTDAVIPKSEMKNKLKMYTYICAKSIKFHADTKDHSIEFDWSSV